LCSQCLNDLPNSLCPYCRLPFEKTLPNWQIIDRIHKPSHTFLSDFNQPIKFQTSDSRAFLEVFSTLNSITHLRETNPSQKFDSEAVCKTLFVFIFECYLNLVLECFRVDICFLVLFLGIYPISMVIVGSYLTNFDLKMI
jgi:hypothetical protein